MNKFGYFFLRIKEEFYRQNKVISFAKKRTGIKNTNASLLLNHYEYVLKDNYCVSASELFLGPDFLRDDFTLLCTNILDSPHFSLMESLMYGKEIENTDYVRRLLSGKLDWRDCTIMPKDKEYFRKRFNKSFIEIKEDRYKPIIIYNQGKRSFIYDGKHRAALCCLLNVPVRCVVVDNLIAHDGVWRYMFNLLDGDNTYRRHIDYHCQFLTERKKND